MNIICCVVMSVSILSMYMSKYEFTYVEAIVMQHTNTNWVQIL